jgi:hypothetical protein
MKKLQPSGQSASKLRKVPGGPNPADTQALTDQAKESSYGSNYVISNGARQASNEYPFIPFARDDYDDIANVKRQFAIGGAQRVVTLDSEDAEHALRQRAQIEKVNFDNWVMTKYDMSDPAQNFLMQQIAPDQFKRRADLIEAQQNLVTKYALIRLHGAKNISDLKLQWMIETGRTELPKGPIWDPIGWMNAQMGTRYDKTDQPLMIRRATINNERYRKGLFNPLNYLSENQVGKLPGRNRSDIAGSDKPMDNQFFAGSSARSPYQVEGQNPLWTMYPVAYDAVAPGVVPGINIESQLRRTNLSRIYPTRLAQRDWAKVNPGAAWKDIPEGQAPAGLSKLEEEALIQDDMARWDAANPEAKFVLD